MRTTPSANRCSAGSTRAPTVPAAFRPVAKRGSTCSIACSPEICGEMTVDPFVEDEWLWGWDRTPGIVSVWAEPAGRVTVWRRLPGSGELVVEEERFRPWILLNSLDDLAHLGAELAPEQPGARARVTYRELE